MSDTVDNADRFGDEEVAFGDTLVSVDGLTKYFSQDSGILGGISIDTDGGFPITFDRTKVRAVEDVSFEIRKGETLGLVGESGCGKSTLARTLIRLIEPTDGSVYFNGRDLSALESEELRKARKNVQMIFQDPQSSLDPRMKVGRIVEQPMRAHGMYGSDSEREARTRELLEKVGLDPQHYNRYPHAFSGGQRQRINLARALAVNPDFIVCDEPVSALDVSIQAQVLNTMQELQEEFGLTYLFIAHDLSVIRHISDRVAVMYLGQIAELAETKELFENPQHPYTQALLGSIPTPDPRSNKSRQTIDGDVPSPIDPPSGCRFRTRCPELIAPDQYDLEDGEWADVRAFMRSVDRRTFELGSGPEIEERFFDGRLPDGEVGTLIADSIDDIRADRWDEASEALIDAFAEQSICAQQEPSYETEPVYSDETHYAACHLHRD
jgi:peptide/nickel transport system ATP-binding protein